jgi:hypothetical protein
MDTTTKIVIIGGVGALAAYFIFKRQQPVAMPQYNTGPLAPSFGGVGGYSSPFIPPNAQPQYIPQPPQNNYAATVGAAFSGIGDALGAVFKFAESQKAGQAAYGGGSNITATSSGNGALTDLKLTEPFSDVTVNTDDGSGLNSNFTGKGFHL